MNDMASIRKMWPLSLWITLGLVAEEGLGAGMPTPSVASAGVFFLGGNG
jgi:hypothetical protein